MSTGSLLPGSAKSEQQQRADVCVAGRWMYERGYIVACEGNLSVRLDEERVLTTPTCMNKGMLAPEDLVITGLDGRQLAGQRKVSSELAMHLLIYRSRFARSICTISLALAGASVLLTAKLLNITVNGINLLLGVNAILCLAIGVYLYVSRDVTRYLFQKRIAERKN